MTQIKLRKLFAPLGSLARSYDRCIIALPSREQRLREAVFVLGGARMNFGYLGVRNWLGLYTGGSFVAANRRLVKVHYIISVDSLGKNLLILQLFISI